MEDQRIKDAGKPETAEADSTDRVDLERRAALRNLGALAGAAPAVAVLLSPSASRAWGSGGSDVDDDHGWGSGHGWGSNNYGYGSGYGYGSNNYGYGSGYRDRERTRSSKYERDRSWDRSRDM